MTAAQIWLAGRFDTDEYFSAVVEAMESKAALLGLNRPLILPPASDDAFLTCRKTRRTASDLLQQPTGPSAVADRRTIVESSRRSALVATARTRERYACRLQAEALVWATRFRPGEDVIVWSESPHFAWDLARYFELRNRGVPQMIIRRTALRHLITVWSGFGNDDRMLRRPLLNASSQAILQISASTIDLADLMRDGPILYSRTQFVPPKKSAKRPLVRRLGKSAFRVMKYLSHLQAPYFSLPPLFGLIVILRRRAQVATRDLLFRRFCASEIPALDAEKYIYFPLQVRPERSLMPEALVGSDQFQTLVALAKSLPDGWKILVKEHPNHVDTGFGDVRKVLQRDLRLYRLLATSPRIVWIESNNSTDDLLPAASLVFTGTGSAAWEACTAGTPAVVTGRAWHESHELTWSWHSEPKDESAFAEELGQVLAWAEQCTGSQALVREANARFISNIQPFLIPGASGVEMANFGESVAPTESLAEALLSLAESLRIPW